MNFFNEVIKELDSSNPRLYEDEDVMLSYSSSVPKKEEHDLKFVKLIIDNYIFKTKSSKSGSRKINNSINSITKSLFMKKPEPQEPQKNLFQIKIHTFLLALESFVHPFKLILYLTRCFFFPQPLFLSPSEKIHYRNNIEMTKRIRILMIVEKMMRFRNNDISTNAIISNWIINLCYHIISNKFPKTLKNCAHEIISKSHEIVRFSFRGSKNSEEKSSWRNFLISKFESQNLDLSLIKEAFHNISEVPELLQYLKKKQLTIGNEFLTKSAAEISQDLNDFDSKLFMELQIIDVFSLLIQESSENTFFRTYQERFNQLSYYGIAAIIFQKTVDLRVNVLLKYFAICKQLISFKNYLSLMIFYSIISSPTLDYLSVTWSKAEGQYSRLNDEFKYYKDLFEPSYSNLRKKLKADESYKFPVIPSLNIYQRTILKLKSLLFFKKDGERMVSLDKLKYLEGISHQIINFKKFCLSGTFLRKKSSLENPFLNENFKYELQAIQRDLSFQQLENYLNSVGKYIGIQERLHHS